MSEVMRTIKVNFGFGPVNFTIPRDISVRGLENLVSVNREKFKTSSRSEVLKEMNEIKKILKKIPEHTLLKSDFTKYIHYMVLDRVPVGKKLHELPEADAYNIRNKIAMDLYYMLDVQIPPEIFDKYLVENPNYYDLLLNSNISEPGIIVPTQKYKLISAITLRNITDREVDALKDGDMIHAVPTVSRDSYSKKEVDAVLVGGAKKSKSKKSSKKGSKKTSKKTSKKGVKKMVGGKRPSKKTSKKASKKTLKKASKKTSKKASKKTGNK